MMLKKTMIVFVMFLLILSSLSISMASTDNSLEETGPTKTGERTEDDGIDEETKFSSRSRWSEEDEPPYLVSELDGLEVTLSASLPETEFVNAKMPDGESYSVITSARQGKGEIGKPDVPVFKDWILIPEGTSPQVEVDPGEPVKYEDVNIPPVQISPIASSDGSIREFTKDTETYENDADYPGTFTELGETGSLRGQDLTMIKTFPYQYNAVEERLKVYPDLTVTVDFAGEVRPTPRRFEGTNFELIMRRLAVNADQVLKAQEKVAVGLNEDMTSNDDILSQNGGGSEGAARYLIITDPIFEDEVADLAEWKNKKGMSTYIATTDETGDTAAEITAYIENAYNNWNPSPSYLLLFGDAEYIPPHYKTEHTYYDDNRKIGTDIYYGAMEQTQCEYFPDISVGRMTVDSQTQAQRRVDQIIKYERDPVTSSAFYEDPTHAAQFQDYGDEDYGYADRRFTMTSEDISIFLGDQNYLGEYTPERIYEYTGSAKPEYWNNNSYFDGGPAGDGGDPIPDHLANDWEKASYNQEIWGGDATEISSEVNDGTFLLTHRDHGGTGGWGTPSYGYTDVNDLTNGDKLPVVWSLNCNTGYYDHETANDSSTHTISFVEAWEDNSNGGAAGVIAATRVSYSNHNDRLTWGFTDAIWPSFLSYSGDHSKSQEPPARRMGDALNYGKYYYATHFGDYSTRKKTFEMFHWFGDPTMRIRTEAPKNLNLDYPDRIPAGNPQEVTITVEDALGYPQANATVALQKGSDVYEVGTTDTSGEVTFNIHPDTPGTINLTASKYNFIPSEETITVTEVDSVTISPSQSQTITAGDTIDFSAEAYDSYGSLITDDDKKFVWQNAGDDGLFGKTTAGTHEVTATAGSVTSDPVSVTVEPAEADTVSITPSQAQTIKAGDTINFSAEAYDVYGNLITAQDTEFNWDNADDSGTFEKTTAGDHEVWSEYQGVASDTVTVTVEPGEASSVTIIPSEEQTVKVKETIDFDAEAYDQYGNLVTDVDTEFEWKNADADGVFEEKTETGYYDVRAVYQGIPSDPVTVTVKPGEVSTVSITPQENQTVKAGHTIEFNAEAYDKYGNQITEKDSEFNWTNADADGIFEETELDDYKVRAIYQSVPSEPVTVTVKPGEVSTVSITPWKDQTLKAGESMNFSAEAYDKYGNKITENESDFNWQGADNASFKEVSTGHYDVSCTYGGVSSKVVNVTVEAAETDRVEIEPSEDQTIHAGQTIDFSAEAYDVYDNLITDDDTEFNWTNTDENGVFNETTEGEHEVKASYEGLMSNRVTVTVESSSYILTVNLDGEGTVDINGQIVESDWTGEFDYGTEVDLTAEPHNNWYFNGWTGDLESKEKNITITMESDIEFTAHFKELQEGEKVLTLMVEGEGTTQPSVGMHTYDEGTEVTIEATPAEDWQFVEWTGDVPTGEGESSEVSLEMDENRTLTARFEKVSYEYQLVTKAETGGTTDPSPGTYTYEEGREVIVEASPDQGWGFSHWMGDYPEGEQEKKKISFVMDSDVSLKAYFQDVNESVEYDLKVEAEGGGETDPPLGVHTYNKGELVPLEAISDKGWKFDRWTGDVSSEMEDKAEITIEMNGNLSITARFEELSEYELTIKIEGEGSVEPAVGTHTYFEGDEVTVQASPADNWFFDRWSGDYPDGSERKKKIKIIMDGEKTLTANFEEGPLDLEVDIQSPADDTEFDRTEEVIVNCNITDKGDIGGEQKVEFVVKDSEGNVVYNETKLLDIPAEGVCNGEFTWEPEKEGEYDLVVRSAEDDSLTDSTSVSVSSTEQNIADKGDDDGLLWLILPLVGSIAFGAVTIALLVSSKDEDDAVSQEEFESTRY